MKDCRLCAILLYCTVSLTISNEDDFQLGTQHYPSTVSTTANMVRPSSPSNTPSRRRRTRTVSMQAGDSFFGNNQSSLGSSSRSVTSTSSVSSDISTVSRTSRSGRRIRAVTLVPGSVAHNAFFGGDEKLRETFDQESATDVSFAHKRNYIRE